MPRKDVDLVIKARDEAASVVDSITSALERFIDAQKNLDTRADKTEGTLTALGSAIAQLDKQFKGLSAGEKLSGDLDKAAAALARMEGKFEGTSQEAAQLERQLRQTGVSVERLAQKQAGAATAQNRQSAALKKAKIDQRELTKAYEQAVGAQEKLARRQEKLPGLLDRASAAASKAATRFDDLSAQIAGTVSPSKTLKNQMEASQRSMASTAARLAKLREEYGRIGGSLRVAGSAITLFGAQSERATASVAKQEVVVKKIGVNLNTLKTQSAAASRQQNKLAGDFAKVTSSLSRQSQAIDRAESDYVQLAQAAGQADAALQRLSSAGLTELEGQLRGQRRAVLDAKRAYVEATDAATRLGRSTRTVVAPTKDLVAAFERARVEARTLKAQLLQQRVAYEQLGGSLRGTTADIDSVRASQQRFTQVQAALAAGLERSSRAAKRQKTEINQLHGVTGNAVQTANRLTTAQERLARANKRAAGSTSRLAAAYRQFYGDTRRSLSLLQRVRGEVLSLVAAYAGLFAGIQVLQGTVKATLELEAAQSRLGVAFGGDTTRVASELDFLRRTANRLGVDLGTLASEYSKFNIATKNTSLEGAAARKIFIQVAEAARVNRSSTAELSGVFVALTQIVSKGAVQMEELRQQLGDRLPGALKIMADGLGVSTQELVKMMEQGQVTEAALIPFADELERRFGPGLGEALASLSVALGRLGNAAFQALVKFGKAGFIDSFQDFVNSLTETLQSADFEAFSARVSSALGSVVGFLGFLAENFRLVFAAAAGFIGLRLAPVILVMANSFGTLTAGTAKTVLGFKVLQVRAAAMGVTLTRTGFAVRTLTRFLRGLLSTTGIGLAIVAISAGLALWSTEADKATEALNAHRKLVDQVKDAYDRAGGAIGEWRKNLDDVTAQRARKNLREIKDAVNDATNALLQAFTTDGETFLQSTLGLGAFVGASRAYNRAIKKIIDSFRDGTITAEELRTQIDETNEEFNDGSKAHQRYGDSLDEATAFIVKMAEAEREAQAVLDAKTGSVEDAEAAAKALGIANEEAADALDPEKTAAFIAAMEGLKKIIDDTAESTVYLATVMKIDGAFADAIANAQTLEERISAAISQAEALQGATQQFVDTNFGGFTDGVEATAALIRQFEGFRATPYFDVNAQRAGFGSDTITLADGSIQKITEGMRVSVVDANRDLLRRITTEFRPKAEAAAGTARFAAFTPQQQASLTSIAYNYGSIPDRIVEAVRTGSDEQIAAAIQSLAGDNEGVNRNRRLQEAALFTSGAAVTTQVQEAQRLIELEETRRGQTTDRIADNEFEISQQELLAQGKERQAAIEEAIREARRENPAITQEEIDKITEQTASIFDQEQAISNRTTATERAQAAETELNNLLSVQQSLREQLEIVDEQGDTTRAEELRVEIEGMNAAILQAIDNAIRMWEAVGGGAADAAIAKLNTAKLGAQALANEADNTYLKWDRVADLFVQGLAKAFDTFAKAVAEGASVGEAAKQAFLQFASDFLLQIAKMIIQQAIFNALKAAFGGTSFGSLIGLPTGHSGGVVGSGSIGSGGNLSRRISPSSFIGARKFHNGGLPGLRPGEVPAILEKGEEVITRDDPRHVLNSAATSAGKRALTLINAVNGSAALEQALSESEGQDTFMNYMRGNRDEIKQVLG